jgi:WD40 repeat protein
VSVDSLVTALDCAVAGGSAVTVTGHADGSLRLWHFADPESPVTLLAAGGSPVVAVACAGSADGRPAIAVTRHADGSCLTWDLECRTRSGEALPDERSAVVAVALTPPGPPHATPALAVDGHANGVIVVRDAVKGTPVGPPLAGTSTEARLQSLTCLTGGGHPFVLAGYQDGTLDLFDLIARTLVESTSVSAGVTALSWTPNPPTDGLLTMVAGAELYVLGGGFDG